MGRVRVAVVVAALALVGSYVLQPERLIEIQLVDHANDPWKRSLVETTLQCISTQTEETTWHPLHKPLERVQLPAQEQRCKVTSPTVVSAEFTLAASPSEEKLNVTLYSREKRLRLHVRDLPASERILTTVTCYDTSNQFSYTFSRLDAKDTQEMSVTDGPLRCVLSLGDLDYAEQLAYPKEAISDLIFDYPKFNSQLNVQIKRPDGSPFLVPEQHSVEVACWSVASKSDPTRREIVARAKIESGQSTASAASKSGWSTCSAHLVPNLQDSATFAVDMQKGTKAGETSHIFVPLQDEIGRIHDDLPNEISFVAHSEPAMLRLELPELPQGTSPEDILELECASHSKGAPYRLATQAGDIPKATFAISPEDIQKMSCQGRLNGHQSPRISVEDGRLPLVFPQRKERLDLSLGGVGTFDNTLEIKCTHAQYKSGDITQHLSSLHGINLISAIPGDYKCKIVEGEKARSSEFSLSLGEKREKRTINLLKQESCRTDLSFTQESSGEVVTTMKGYLEILSENHSSKQWFNVLPPLRFRAGTASFEVPQGFKVKLPLFDLAKRFPAYALPSAVTYECTEAVKKLNVTVVTKPEELRTQVKFKNSRTLTVTEIKQQEDGLAPHVPSPLLDDDLGDTVYQLIPGRTYLATSVSESPNYISRNHTVEVHPGKSIKRLSIWLPEAKKSITIRTLVPADRVWSRRVRSLVATCEVSNEGGYFIPAQHIVELNSSKDSLEKRFRMRLPEEPTLNWNISCQGVGEIKKSDSSMQNNWNSDEFSFVKFTGTTTLKGRNIPQQLDLLLFPTDEVIPLAGVPGALLE